MSDYSLVPQELRDWPQWVIWRAVDRDGRTTKVPYRADGAGRASSTDPATWATFEQAVAGAEALAANGIGFAFSEKDPFAGVDLDSGLSKEDQASIELQLDSYTERSPSGNGAHVIVKASLNGHNRNRKGPFEVYDHGRYFTVTGDHIQGTPLTIEERQAQLDAVLERFLPKAAPKLLSNALDTSSVGLDDRELLDKAMSAKNGPAFTSLYQGSWEGHYPSQSEADQALCSLLAFWTGNDPDRIDRLFRTSGLYRDKWERLDYRENTIANALGGDVYTPSQSSRPGWDATGTRTASRTSEKGETAIASPRPDVVGTRDGTRSFSDASNSPILCFRTASEFAGLEEEGDAPILGDPDEAVVAEGSDVMFYGDGGAGKTTMMLDLALHLAAGDDWLGISVPHPIRVGIVENEGPRPLFRAKLRRKLAGWPGSDIGDRLLLLEEPWAKVSLDDPGMRQALAEAIAKYELDTVLLGPVARSGMNEAGTLQQVRDYTNLIADVRVMSLRRVAFLLAHHENRGGAVSGAWEGAVDTLFHVQAQGHGQTRLYIQKARWAPKYHKQTLKLLWADGEGFEVVEEEERDDNTVADELLAFVRENGGTGWSRVDEAVAGKGTRLRAIRDNLIAGGRLVNVGTEARMKLWHADDPAVPTGEGAS